MTRAVTPEYVKAIVTESQMLAGALSPGRARVTFTEFRSSDDRILQSWMGFRALLTAGFTHPGFTHASAVTDPVGRTTAQSTPGQPPVAATQSGQHSGFWRLLASNNREVARSFLLYDGHQRAQAHLRQLQAHPESLKVVSVRVQRNGSRGWVITFEDSPVVMCSRWYDSISTGIAAAEGVLAALPTATPAAVPDRSTRSRRLRRHDSISDELVTPAFDLGNGEVELAVVIRSSAAEKFGADADHRRRARRHGRNVRRPDRSAHLRLRQRPLRVRSREACPIR